MFSFTNKKVMGVWSSEVKCIKWMENSKVIKKKQKNQTLEWKYIISLVIGITFICFRWCIDITAKYKIKACLLSV